MVVDTLFQSPSFEVVNLGGSIGCSLEARIYRSVTGRKVMDGVVSDHSRINARSRVSSFLYILSFFLRGKDESMKVLQMMSSG